MRKSLALPFIIVIAVAIGGLLFLFGGAAFRENSFKVASSPAGTSITTTGTPSTTAQGTPRTSILGIGQHLDTLTLVGEGNYTQGVSDRVNYRITTADQFSQLVALVYGNNPPSIPPVDFTKNEVLAVFDGSHSTGGYGIRIDSIKDQYQQRTITVTHVVPGPNCMTASSVSSPFVIVSLKKSELPISHVENTETSSCQ